MFEWLRNKKIKTFQYQRETKRVVIFLLCLLYYLCYILGSKAENDLDPDEQLSVRNICNSFNFCLSLSKYGKKRRNIVYKTYHGNTNSQWAHRMTSFQLYWRISSVVKNSYICCMSEYILWLECNGKTCTA